MYVVLRSESSSCLKNNLATVSWHHKNFIQNVNKVQYLWNIGNFWGKFIVHPWISQDFNFQFLWIYVMRMVETTENFEKLIVQVPRILFKMSSHRDYSSSRSSSSSRSYEDDYYPSSKRSRDSSNYSTSSSAARRSSARFRCEMCDVSVESKAIYETHLTSQDHLRYGAVHKWRHAKRGSKLMA